jgi:hypothetical protein
VKKRAAAVLAIFVVVLIGATHSAMAASLTAWEMKRTPARRSRRTVVGQVLPAPLVPA